MQEDSDYVWVHDYHLMCVRALALHISACMHESTPHTYMRRRHPSLIHAHASSLLHPPPHADRWLPYELRQRFKHANIGWFLHTPFPSSEIYRILPVRKALLEALLAADLLGQCS